MPTYVVEYESGEYEEREKDVYYAGPSLKKALRCADKGPKFGTVYLSEWARGECVSEYFRDHDKAGHRPWEKNCGEDRNYLEVDHG